MRNRSTSQRGMTLVEVMVATVVLALAIILALVVYDASRKSFKRGESATEQQEAVRIAYDKLTSDLRLLGYNVNPDGANRPDEQLEAALDHAIIFRGDFDAEDPSARTTPESALAGGAFNTISTGNDEIVGYVLEQPGGGGPDSISFQADVGTSPRDGNVETVTVNNIVLNPTNPPYDLYKISLSNNTGSCCSGNFIIRTPVVENVQNLQFTYNSPGGTFKDASSTISEAAADKATRNSMSSVNVRLIGMTNGPDPNYADPTETSSAPDYHYRKFTLEGDIIPRNLRLKGIQDLDATTAPPSKPATPSLVAGHCNALLVSWTLNPTSDNVAYYIINYGTSSGAVTGTRSSGTSPFYLDSLTTGTTYYVTIQAQNYSGALSPKSDEVSATVTNTNTPSRPGSFSTSTGQTNFVHLVWSPVTTNTANNPAADPAAPQCRDLAGYRVYRADSSSFTAAPANLLVNETVVHGPNSPPYDDSPTVNCHNYYYRVTAVDQCGAESAVSPTGSASQGSSTTTIQPKPPANVNANMTVPGQATVTWTPTTQDVQSNPIAITAYDIYRSNPIDKSLPASSAVFGSTPIATSPGPSYTDIGVPGLSGTMAVWYELKAKDECVNYSDFSSAAQALCPFSGTITINPPADNGVVAGVVPTTVTMSGGTDTYTGVTITYTHSVAGVTRTYTSSTPGTTWTDSGWLADPPGAYTITATVTNAGGCANTTSIHVQAGSVVGCCLSMQPTTNTYLTCASGGVKCKEISYKMGNGSCLTAVSVHAMTVAWTDNSGNNPQWQTVRFNGTNIAAVGSWTVTYGTGTPQTGSATKNDFGTPRPSIPYLSPVTGGNATTVTYVFNQQTDSGSGGNRKVDVFGTNQYLFTLLDSLGNESGITTTCNFQNLTVN